ncbi:MAG TPA: beta-ketoacyl-[acyl-carrier-protein] synthase family protein [Verrucomicrobiae bacterium]|nr:beta-ketoacyl-[acyl-carrier-protein] synthase family protein [Verrucomicrobiae bacterium]
MAARFPVITGLGIMAATGCGVDEVWNSIRATKSGLKPLTLFQSPRYGQIPAGEIQQDLLALGAPSHGSRSDQLGWLAAREAIAAAKINFSDCADRAGVVLGCSVGGSFDSERFLTTLIKTGKMRARPTRFHECASVVDLIADEFGLLGPGMAVTTACSSSALAIATAAEMIMAGEADVMLAGGADSLSRMTWGGFHSLLLIDSEGCRPFDAKRVGTSLGEGAAILILESEEFAKRRDAKILARLTGWGASCDAHHTTAPHPEGEGAVAAMQSALNRAGLESSDIDYINAHGTGTRDNDLVESKALKAVFGSRVPPFSSTKHFFGHALAASGAIEAVVCVEALRHQEMPSNPGFLASDPAIGLEPVTKFQRAALTHVMSNSFGFGGNNAVLIFSKPETIPLTRAPESKPIAITGLGVIGPGAITEREIEKPLPPGKVLVHSCGALADTALLTPNQRRRFGRLVQMALIAARRSHAPDPSQRLAVAIGTGLGCLEDAGIFLENLISKDEREPMPARFPNSVHNAPAAQIAIDQNACAMNSAPTMGEISFESALWQGMRQLEIGEADCALVGAVDELNKYPLAIGKRWKLWNEKTIPGEGAMVASLTRTENSATSLARVIAVRLGRWRKPFDAEREADWIATAADLKNVGIILSGAGGWPDLDENFSAVAAALSKRAGRKLEHQTYKQLCGEFHSASAFGFSVAVEMAREKKSGVLLYTLSPRGAKAICCVQP